MPSLPQLPFSRLLLVSAIALSLSACGGSDNDDDDVVTPPAAVAGDVFVLTASNKLLSFNRETPATVRTTVTVTGPEKPAEPVIVVAPPAQHRTPGGAEREMLAQPVPGIGVAGHHQRAIDRV